MSHPQTGPAPRARSSRKRWLALVLSLLASLIGVELLVRGWLGSPLRERLPILFVRANKKRGWEMVPGREHYTYEHRVAVNALGLRGAELAAKAPDERRILFLGDSLTYGQGVGDEETVPAALEQALEKHAPRVRWRVVNAGVRAYGTSQELGLLEELGARIAPEVVLLGWYWNDVSERPIADTYAEFLPRGEFAFDTGNRLEGLDDLRWRVQELLRRSALLMLAHDLVSTKGTLYAPEVHEQGMRRLEEQLGRFAALCGELAATPVVVIFPDRHRLTGAEDTRPFEERAAALGRARGLVVVELLPALVALYQRSHSVPILPFDGHYDPAANAAMGRFLAEGLAGAKVLERGE
jgi:lysophospholipase L1-like esterase